MPTFKYSPIPSVEPATSAGTGFQNIRATPQAFGADQGTALRELGQQFERAGDVLANAAVTRQNLLNQVTADDYSNKALDAANKILYGDPDKPGDVGFYGLKGEAAMRSLPDARKRLDQALLEHRSALQNPVQQHLFDRDVRRTKLILNAEMGRHYDRESNRYTASVYEGRIAVSKQEMSKALAQGDYEKADAEVAKQISDATKLGVFSGLDYTATQAKINEITMTAIETKAERLMAENPLAAQKFLENNRDKLPAEKVLALEGRVKAAAIKQEADDIVAGRPSKVVPGLVRGGAVDKFLDLAEQEESRGRNIEQQIVPPGGGYNPSVGRVTGPSTASGYWQITDTTWRNFRGEVDGAEKYARAMDAPKEIQRAVARQIATSSGVQHWTDYNKSLRAVAAREGLPVNGPVRDTVAKTEGGPDQVILPALDPGELPDDQVPGLASIIQQKLKDPRAVKDGQLTPAGELAIKNLRRQANIAWTEQQRARQLELQARKQVVENEERELYSLIYPEDGSPSKVTATQIANNPNLSPEGISKMLGALRSSTEQPANSEISKATYSRLYTRMILPDGNSEKITTPELIDQALVNRELTPADHRSLRKELFDDPSPTGIRRKEAKADFMKGFEAMITKSNPMLGVIDQDGMINFSRFKFAVDEEVARMLQEKKDPVLLFNPKSPEYLGTPKFLDQFMKPLSESTKDISKGMRGNPGYVAPPIRALPGSPVFTAPIPGAVPPRQPEESPAAYEKRIGR